MNAEKFFHDNDSCQAHINKCKIWAFGLILLISLNTLHFSQISSESNSNSNEEAGFEIIETDPRGYIQEAIVPTAQLYLRNASVGYARLWYNDRNNHYYDYSSSGGDCANFVSQCLIAGGISLHRGTDGSGTGVYPDTGNPSSHSNGTMPYCDYMHLNLKNYQNTVVTYVEDTNATVPDHIEIGDVVIFGNKSIDRYQHAMIVVTKTADRLGLAGHTTDIWDQAFETQMLYRSCATFYHFNDAPAGYYHFKVTATALNVRVGPSTNKQGVLYESIGTLSQNQEYVAFDYTFDTSGKIWWHFWFDDRAAWCCGNPYTINVTGNTPVEVNVDTSVRIRDGPGTTYDIYCLAYDGLRFISTAIEGEWHRIFYGGSEKYIYSYYVFSLDEMPEEIPTYNGSNVVIGFLPFWVNENQNWTPLSHVAWFSVDLNSDGTIANAHGWPKTTLVNNIHNTNTKVLLTATLMNSASIHTLISTPSYRTTAVNTLLQQVQAGNADGIVIDFEQPTTAGDDVYLVTFMQELSTTFKAENPDYYVSICTPAVDWWGTYDYPALTQWADSLMLMGYDYYYKGSPTAGPTAPLYGSGYNINRSVYTYINKGTARSKIVLGLPFYGNDWPVNQTVRHATTIGNGVSITYSGNLAKIAEYNPTLNYDSIYECQWYNYVKDGTQHQVWCDNVQSLGAKMNYINNEELGGLGVWAWGYQGTSGDLENLISQKIPVDKYPPQIAIIKPSPNQIFVNSAVEIEWQATDDTGINYFEISLNNGTTFTNVSLNTTTTAHFENGNYKIIVRAVDLANRTANASVDITVDFVQEFSPPEITITKPTNDSSFTDYYVQIQWNAISEAGLSYFEVSYDNGSCFANVGLVYSIEHEFANGDYLIIVRAVDVLNKTDEDSVVIHVQKPDDLPPDGNDDPDHDGKDEQNTEENTETEKPVIQFMKENMLLVVLGSIGLVVFISSIIIIKKKRSR